MFLWSSRLAAKLGTRSARREEGNAFEASIRKRDRERHVTQVNRNLERAHSLGKF